MEHLVIGGAGFIGVNLAARLLDEGERVTILDNFSRRGTLENAEWLKSRHPQVAVVGGDVRSDRGLLERLVAESDAVYHLAAQVAVTSSVADPRMDFEVNALGTLNVLEAVRRGNPDATLVYSSTNKVYGEMADVPVVEGETRYTYAGARTGIAESHPLDFHSPYGCSKGTGDQYVRDYARIFGLKTVVLRQSCIYGPRQFGIEDQGWLAWFCIAATLEHGITIYGTGKQVRDVLHVDDLIDVVRLAVESDAAKGEIYNIGGGPAHSLSLLEALALLEEELGRPIEFSFAPSRPGDQPVYVSDIGKAYADLGWAPRVDVAGGLAQLVEWVTSNRDLFQLGSAYSRP